MRDGAASVQMRPLTVLIVWTAILVLPSLASGQGCSGATPNDVCEQTKPGLAQIHNIPDKTALSPASRKIASTVREAVDAIRAHSPSAESPSDLVASSTKIVRINAAGEIHVYVILAEFRPEYVAQLEAVGLRTELTLPDFRLVQGWVPANLVDLIASFDFVVEVRPPGYAVPRVGAQLTAGDSILKADSARSTFGVTGAGVTVGVLSDGVTHLAQSVATGDLPAGVQVLRNPGGDEGTAMLEIVHDLAPGAAFAFYGVSTSADMVNGINSLAAAGARVVVDDIGFPDEPKFQDGMIAQTARNFATGGKVYVTSAGNEAQSHYRAPYNRLTGQIPNSSYPAVHNYVPSPGVDIGNTFTLPVNCNILVVLQWNNPNGASADDFDLFLVRSSDGVVLAGSTNFQTGTQDAREAFAYRNASGSPVTVFIAVTEFNLTSPASSLVLDYLIFERCGIASGPGFKYVTSADSVFGHSAVNEVLSVAALNALTPTQAAPYSSRGPGSISFPTPETRSVPNIGGIDCVVTEVGVLGFFPNPFCGTSAAAPHVAAIAALLIERNPALTSQQLWDRLTGTAVDLGSPGPDFTFGFGRADALAAVAAISPNPFLAVSPAEPVDFGRIVVGGSVDRPFTIRNDGGGTLTGNASVPSPFAIVSGGSFSLGSGASQAMVVRFTRSAPGVSSVSLAVTSNGGNIAVSVSGTGVPDVRGTYPGSGTLTQSNCQNPANNGTFAFISTVVVTSQTGGTFGGSATLNYSVSGVAFVTTVTLSGTVNGSSALMGSFTFTTTANGQPRGSGIGAFTGSLNGPSLSIQFMGQLTSGDLCIISGPLTGMATQRTLTVLRRGSGTGSVASVPAGVACPGTCSALFNDGMTVMLTATAGAGSTFREWRGGCTGTAPTCTVTMAGSQSVQAVFSIVFTDPTLIPGVTVIRAVQVLELRDAIGTLRVFYGLPAFAWTNPLTAGVSVIQAVDVAQLRQALQQIAAVTGTTLPAFTDPTLVPGVIVREAHIAEPRADVLLLE